MNFDIVILLIYFVDLFGKVLVYIVYFFKFGFY